MNRVGLGKTLGEIYDEFNKVNKERQTIEGYDKQELLITLDHYLQSLYLD